VTLSFAVNGESGGLRGKEAARRRFPAHRAPNDLKIYKGKQFPQAYRGGAFIAFHGSWNRAPGPQGGYNIDFQPLVGGKPSGDYIVFAARIRERPRARLILERISAHERCLWGPFRHASNALS
jgi:glucose/arabinose dehydrogenase